MSRLFLEIVPRGTKIDFMKRGPFFFGLSTVVMAASVGLLAVKGLSYGVDFTGGTEIHARFSSRPDAGKLRGVISAAGLGEPTVQGFGERGSGEFLIRMESTEMDLKPLRPALEKALEGAGPAGGKPKLVLSEGRFYVTYDAPVEPDRVRQAVDAAAIPNVQVASVDRFGAESANEYVVLLAGVGTRIVEALKRSFGKEEVEILQIEQVGPKVGRELRMQAIGAVLVSMLFILIYVWFRFEFDFAVGAILALFHDPILVLGMFSLLGLQFDLTIVAAVLTLVGYSINDTIVVFDRIRENLRRTKDPQLPAVINLSVNETLGRTILTSLATLLAAASLLVLGGPVTFNFCLAFSVGILTGTYSSIFVAAPATIYLRRFLDRRKLRSAG